MIAIRDEDIAGRIRRYSPRLLQAAGGNRGLDPPACDLNNTLVILIRDEEIAWLIQRYARLREPRSAGTVVWTPLGVSFTIWCC